MTYLNFSQRIAKSYLNNEFSHKILPKTFLVLFSLMMARSKIRLGRKGIKIYLDEPRSKVASRISSDSFKMCFEETTGKEEY